jgi:hypothetical protein
LITAGCLVGAGCLGGRLAYLFALGITSARTKYG